LVFDDRQGIVAGNPIDVREVVRRGFRELGAADRENQSGASGSFTKYA
jgi:hypothetical protein